MTTQEVAILNALDQDTARLVARLVDESSSSIELALAAVQEVDRARRPSAVRPPWFRQRLTLFLRSIGAR